MVKKVLFISDHGDPLAKLGGKQSGGQNNYVRQLALSLDKRGVQVDVVTHWSDPLTSQIEKFGQACRVIRISAEKKGFVSKYDMYDLLPNFYSELKKMLHLTSYDIVHTHYYLSGLLGIKLKEEFDLPFVHTSHSLDIAKEKATGKRDERRQKAEKEILQSAAVVLATTKSEKILIGDFVSDSALVKVIPIGVDTAFRVKGNRSTLRKQLGFNGALIVYAGRFEETKGIFTLLSALRQLLTRTKDSTDVKLLIAGGDSKSIDYEKKLPLTEKLKEAVHGIESYVQFVGPQTQEQLSLFFNAATVTVVPSFYESFGMVAAEAQACGSPVIASNVGGLRNVVKDGETGLLVEAKNAEDLSTAIEAVISNELLAQRLGNSAAKTASEEFQWPAITKKISGLYEEVLHDRKKSLVSHGS